VGRIINKHTGLSVGISILIVDSVVITISGFTFRSFDLVLFSYIALFVSSKMVDVILEGRDYAKQATIYTNKGEDVANAIIKEMNRGVTKVEGKGMYTGKRRAVLFSVISNREEGILRDLVKYVDPEAFMVISNVHEVLGKGFRPRT